MGMEGISREGKEQEGIKKMRGNGMEQKWMEGNGRE